MDIHRWLQDTTDRAPPGDAHEYVPPTFQDPPSVANILDQEYRRKRRRRASDSSIIAPQIVRRQPRGHRRTVTHGELFGRSRRAGQKASESGSESWHGSSRGDTRDAESTVSAERLPAKAYERRARYKTKADRYEPKSGKKKKSKQTDDYRDRGRDAKHVRRKSRRNGDSGRSAGIVQSFQLKNGPKNRRLTVSDLAETALRSYAKTTKARSRCQHRTVQTRSCFCPDDWQEQRA